MCHFCQAQPKLQPNWAELAIFSQFPLNLQILLHPGKVYFSFSMQCIETKPPFCHQWVIVLIKGALTPTPNQTGISFGPKLIAKSHVSTCQASGISSKADQILLVPQPRPKILNFKISIPILCMMLLLKAQTNLHMSIFSAFIPS